MFKQIANKVPRDRDLPERAWTLEVNRRMLDGTLYDVLPYAFHEEYSEANEYISVTKRAPSVRSNVCRVVVEDSVALLFGEGRWPVVDTADDHTRETLAQLMKEARLNQVFTDAAIRGSVGSICFHLRILKGRVFVSALDTHNLTPTYDPEAPDTLLSVTEKRKVPGTVLVTLGYDIPESQLRTDFWFQRTWDTEQEAWFTPWPVRGETPKEPEIDTKRSVQHALGFVPMVWVKNLPGGTDPDGACTFRAAMETVVELDYLLSAGQRTLMYQAAPRLLIKGTMKQDADRLAPGDAIQVDSEGDAKLIETSGEASSAIVTYADKLREAALEAIHGNRSNADKISAAQSGRALELLHQALIWLADNLRVSYGEDALLPLMRMVVQASQGNKILVRGKPIGKLNADEPLTLKWASFFPPTYGDKVEQANALTTLRNAGHISRETAVKTVASAYDIENPDDEVAAIQADQDREMQERIAEKAQTQVKLTGNAVA